MNFSTLVRFSRLVSDSRTSEGIFSLLAETVVEKCGASQALVFGTSDTGDFALLSSYPIERGDELRGLVLDGVASISELRTAVIRASPDTNFDFHCLPLISEAGLFGAMVLIYPTAAPLAEGQWSFIEALTELTAISLNKTYHHQRLQKAFDDLQASQDALVRSEKFRALGLMSAGIAHDLRNLLNPLLLYTDQLRDSSKNPSEVLDLADRVDRILTRGLETVERLTDFGRQSEDEIEAVPTQLNAMVHEAIEISRSRLKGIELGLELEKTPLILVRPADCVTAIVNLLFNAADALEGNGKITVRTGASDSEAWVEVADDGPGMSPEILNRILEPFFTTKGDSGTGLGLSIVYAFTQKHGGRLEIWSESGQGSRFRMWFPGA